jgi:deoxyribodipyrimidine photolyase-related protein
MLAGVSPQEMARWMAEVFIDGAEWVMIPNLIGMAMWADGGRMATKP